MLPPVNTLFVELIVVRLFSRIQWFRSVQFNWPGVRDYLRPPKRSFPDDNDVVFLDFHKANGHASLQVLKKKADKLGLRIVDVNECKTCTEHAFVLEFVNGRKPETRSLSTLEIFHFHVSTAHSPACPPACPPARTPDPLIWPLFDQSPAQLRVPRRRLHRCDAFSAHHR